MFFYSKQDIPFWHRLVMAYFKNTSFGHLMASLSETFQPSKTIVYLIQIIQIDFDIPCNLMALNPCTIPLCISQCIFNIMLLQNICNNHYIVCHNKTQIYSDLDCTNDILSLLWMKQLVLFRRNIIYTCPFWEC